MKRRILISGVLYAAGLVNTFGMVEVPPIHGVLLPDGREVEPLAVQVKGETVVEGVRVLELGFPYIGADGVRHQGERMRLYLPPVGHPPLIVSVHYEMAFEDVPSNIGIQTYIKKGWAVLTPVDLSTEGHENIHQDNLEFTVASTHAAFGMEWIDPQRIGLAGGSAGGYQTLMVAACTPGITAAVVWSPLTHPIYNSEYLRENKALKTPPCFSGWWNTYASNCTWLASRGLDSPENRDLSPTFIEDRITCPILLTHSTADLILPYCQIDREPDPVAVGAFSPGFVHSLADVLPGQPALQRTFFDRIPAEDVARFTLRPGGVSADDPDFAKKEPVIVQMPFSKEKQFSFVTLDEGPINAASGGHFLRVFRSDCIDFLEYHLKKAEEGKTKFPTGQDEK